MGVLGRNPLFGVHQQQGHVGAVERLHRAQHTVFFHARFNFASPPDAGRINQRKFLTVPAQFGVYGVTGGTGNGTDDGPLLA